jgi:hypothetical protein
MRKKVLSVLLLSAVICCSCGKTADLGNNAEPAVSEASSEDSLEEIEVVAPVEASTEPVEVSAVASTESTEAAAEETSVEEKAEKPSGPSPLLLWEYDGYVDECEGYTWKDEFQDCDYDGDGKTDRLWRTWVSTKETALYEIRFGNNKTLNVPAGWETGFPHIQSADLDGDSQNEVLVTLTYDTSTDPNSFGDMWLFKKDKSGSYEEVKLPLDSGENGTKGYTFEYTEPTHGYVHFLSKDKLESGKASGADILDDDYLKNNWTNSATTDFRCVYKASIQNDGAPYICCYLDPFPRYRSTMCFRLYYSKDHGSFVTGPLEKVSSSEDIPSTLDYSVGEMKPKYNFDELTTGTFTLDENGQVKVMFGTMKEVPESGNSYIEHHTGEEEKIYELTDDPYIYLFAPYAYTLGEKVEKDVFMLYLLDYQIDCDFHVDESGKIDYISGWYNA